MSTSTATPPPTSRPAPCSSSRAPWSGSTETGKEQPLMSEEFIGAGWAFPVRTDATGGIALATGDRELEESMRLILATAPGERPMRPEFGCAVHDFVFAP